MPDSEDENEMTEGKEKSDDEIREYIETLPDNRITGKQVGEEHE